MDAPRKVDGRRSANSRCGQNCGKGEIGKGEIGKGVRRSFHLVDCQMMIHNGWPRHLVEAWLGIAPSSEEKGRHMMAGGSLSFTRLMGLPPFDGKIGQQSRRMHFVALSCHPGWESRSNKIR
jgi:hypothetical protein